MQILRSAHEGDRPAHKRIELARRSAGSEAASAARLELRAIAVGTRTGKHGGGAAAAAEQQEGHARERADKPYKRHPPPPTATARVKVSFAGGDSGINTCQPSNVPPGPATVPDGIGAMLFQDCDYGGGWSINLPPGKYTAADLRALGAKDNDTSSLVLAVGYDAILYADDKFTGRPVTLTKSLACLRRPAERCAELHRDPRKRCDRRAHLVALQRHRAGW